MGPTGPTVIATGISVTTICRWTMGHGQARDLQLLGALAETLGGAGSTPALVRATWEVLCEPLGLVQLELVVPINDGREGQVHRADHGGMAAVEIRRLVATRAADAQPHGIRVGACRQGRQPEVRRAAKAGAVQVCAVPLAADPGPSAVLLLAMETVLATDALPLITQIGRVVQAAMRSTQLVGKVAELSRRAHAETQHLRGELARVADPPPVAVGLAMRLVLEAVDQVAPLDTTVLLRGETGTGKDVLARRIHGLSSRAHRPLLRVNCGALPEGLVESTLFGHERGAFTGAHTLHRGLFERADGGTLFLDEVAELPLQSQARLLRVLQEGEFERVGGEATLHANVRLIAATHRPLEELVRDGRFREDLYYRLEVFPIALPPLRDRLQDLPALVEEILVRLCARQGRALVHLSRPSLERLERHAWPGNIRELENVLERALVVSRGERLDLAEQVPTPAKASARESAGEVLTFAESSRRAIAAAITASGGRIYGSGGAADRLGLKPSTLQSKMRRLRMT